MLFRLSFCLLESILNKTFKRKKYIQYIYYIWTGLTFGSDSAGLQVQSGHGSSISMPSPVHLGGWKEEEDENDAELNSESTQKQGMGGTGSC